MTVDGRLDEAAWTETPRIEHFMGRRMLRFLREQVREVEEDRRLLPHTAHRVEVPLKPLGFATVRLLTC